MHITVEEIEEVINRLASAITHAKEARRVAKKVYGSDTEISMQMKYAYQDSKLAWKTMGDGELDIRRQESSQAPRMQHYVRLVGIVVSVLISDRHPAAYAWDRGRRRGGDYLRDMVIESCLGGDRGPPGPSEGDVRLRHGDRVPGSYTRR